MYFCPLPSVRWRPLRAGPRSSLPIPCLGKTEHLSFLIHTLPSHLCTLIPAVSVKVLFFLSSESNFIQFSRPSTVPLSHDAFPDRHNSSLLGTPQAERAPIHIYRYLSLVVWLFHASCLSTVETGTIFSSFVFKQQDLAQCLEYIRSYINVLIEYINKLKERSRLFWSKRMWNWRGH